VRTDRNREKERERERKRKRWSCTEITPVLPVFGKKIPAIFRGISGMFCGISLFLFIHSTISCGTLVWRQLNLWRIKKSDEIFVEFLKGSS
jgi:hypothetical protein